MKKPRHIFRTLLFALGLAICAYPLVTRAANELITMQQMQAVQRDKAAQQQRAAALAKRAAALNMADLGTSNLQQKLRDQLLGTVTLPSIDVQLNLFDNVSDNALNHGAGVVPGSSAPVGGTSTHTVISAHAGLPSKTFFSNLARMQTGDIFIITVAGKNRAYKVDDIATVLPTETDKLKVQTGRDLATLVTCTPVPANTHRLLVTGHRVPYTAETADKMKATKQTTIASSLVILSGLLWGSGALGSYGVWRWRNRA